MPHGIAHPAPPGWQGSISIFSEVGIPTDTYMEMSKWDTYFATLLGFGTLGTLKNFNLSPECVESCMAHDTSSRSTPYTASPFPLLASTSNQGVDDPGILLRFLGRHGEHDSCGTS